MSFVTQHLSKAIYNDREYLTITNTDLHVQYKDKNTSKEQQRINSTTV